MTSSVMPVRSKVILALRRQLAAEIVQSLGPRSQFCIAPHYGIRQPRMSELERGLVERCSIEWLIRRIERMGGSVKVTVTLGDTRRSWWAAGLQRRVRRESDLA